MTFKLVQKYLCALVVSTGLITSVAFAQSYPNRPLTLVIPYAPGGASDAVGRLMAESLARRIGQPVIVSHKPGAGSQIGVDFSAKAAPDGYTILLGTSDGLAVLPAVKQRMPFDALRDFTLISRVATTPYLLAVSSKLPVRTMREFLAYAKANPGAVRYGSLGEGTTNHLAGVMIESMSDVKMTHVPYKGMGPLLTDLLGGHIEMGLSTPLSLAGHMKSDRIRVLTGGPGSPPEAGVPDFDFQSWWGIFAPANLPRPVAERLIAEFAAILRDPDVVAQLQAKGVTPAPLSGAAFQALIASDIKRWKTIAENGRITVPD